jgi:hypothetical protein
MALPGLAAQHRSQFAALTAQVMHAHALLLQVEPQDLQPLTFASHTYDSFHLLMPLYGELCR